MTEIPGRGFYLPEIPTFTLTPSLSTALTIDATGEKAAFAGRVVFPGSSGTKDITRIGLRFGAVTKAGGSGLTVSLQDVGLANGPPIQPDETQDQTVAIANGDAGFVSNAWYRTAALSANRTVNNGDYLAVVVEYNGSGRLGADSVIIAGLTKGSISQFPSQHNAGSSLKTGGTWADQLVIPNIILEFSDGTFGTLEGAMPISALNSQTSNTGSTPDEIALGFKMPWDCEIDALWMIVNTGGATRDFDIVLYQGTTALKTISIDANATPSAASRTICVPIPKMTLTKGTQYYLAHKPTTGNSNTVFSFNVGDANHLTAISGGVDFNYSERTDAGAWAAITTTKRLYAGVRVRNILTASQLVNGGLAQ